MDNESTLKRLGKGPLDRLTNQNLLIKKFGKDGLLTYTSIDNMKTVGEILDETGVDESTFNKILDYMISQNMIDVVGDTSEVEDIIEPEEEPDKPVKPVTPVTTKYNEKTKPIEKDTIDLEKAPEEEKSTEEELTEQERIMIKPEFDDSPKEKDKSSVKVPRPPTIPKSEELEDKIEEEPKEKYNSPKTPIPPKSEDLGDEIPAESEEEEIEEEPKEKYSPPKPPVSTPFESKVEIKPEVEKVETDDTYSKLLTPVERKVYDKFGKVGVKVYSLIDGEKTAEQILKATGISDVKLIEILEYLDTEGIIKLEKPDNRSKLKDLIPMEEKSASSNLLGDSIENSEIVGSDIVPIDIPVIKKMPIIKRLVFTPKLLMTDGGKLKAVYKKVDGNRSIIDLCVETGLSLKDMDHYMELLSEQGALMFKTMNRDDVARRYGDEGLSIYKKFGREGILIYELIGNVSSFREIVTLSGILPERAVEIFVFIHKVLNLELPLTKETMYRQLGLI